MDFWMFWDMIPHPIRKVLLLIIGIASVIGLPIVGVMAGHSIVEVNVAGRSSWRSEADARAAQWDWPVILGWTGGIIGALMLIFSVLYFISKDDDRSAWR